MTTSAVNRLSAWRSRLSFRNGALLVPLAATWCLVLYAALQLHANSGAFWRDEVSSIMLAQLPTVREMFAGLERDSAPLLFALLLKAWMAAGFTDQASLALLGFIIFAGLGGALVWTSRTIGVRLPLFGSLLLLANGAAFYWGTSIRSYGIASLLAALLVGFVWRFVCRGTGTRWVVATLVAILAAQANYQNSYVILSVCLAGSVVCLVQRQFLRSAATLACGMGAALSLLPYHQVIAGSSTWKMLLASHNNPLLRSANSFLVTLGGGPLWLGLLWMALPAYLVGFGCYRFCRSRSLAPLSIRKQRLLFAAVTICLLAITLPVFVLKVGRVMMPYYFLPTLTVLACVVDLPLQRWYRRPGGIWWAAGAATLLLVLQASTLLTYSGIRRTNLDLLAHQVGEQAARGDLVVVSSLWVGHAFGYYYHGAAPWLLLPALTERKVAQMDGALLLEQARQPEKSIAPLIAEVQSTLRSGHRVWVVGNVQIPPDGNLPPVPTTPRLLDCLDYWGNALGLSLQQHAANGDVLPIAAPGPVMYIEELHLSLFEGWHD